MFCIFSFATVNNFSFFSLRTKSMEYFYNIFINTNKKILTTGIIYVLHFNEYDPFILSTIFVATKIT